jgi:O-antigen/teichoic acid export membrane protein
MPFRVLARDSAVYGGADLASKAIAFVTFPLIAAGLSPLGFGALELLMTAVALLGIVANCGLNNAVQRFYYDAETPINARPTLVSSGFAALALLLVASLAIGFAATAGAASWLPQRDLPMTWIAPTAALLLMAGSQVAQYLLDVIRLQMRPWRFFGVSLVSRVATAIVGVVAIVWLEMGLDGLLALQAAVSLLALPLAALAVRRDLTLAVDRTVCFKLFHFGHPFVYSGIAFWLFGSVDRWLLAMLSSVEEVGVYSVAHRLASALMLFSLAFGQAWAPLALKTKNDDPLGYRSMYAEVLLVLACGMLLLGGSIALFSAELLGLLMTAEYQAAASPLAVLCLGVVMQSTTQVTAIGISLEKRTALFARLAWLTAGINVILNLLLIPNHGAIGAAWAMALSYLFLTGSYLYWSQSLHPIPIRWRRVAVWFGLLIVIGVSATQLALNSSNPLTVLLKLLLLVVSASVCYLLVAWKRPMHAAHSEN